MERDLLYIKYGKLCGSDFKASIHESIVNTINKHLSGQRISLRADERYIYVDVETQFSHKHIKSLEYIQGLVAGYMMAYGVEII